MFVKKTILFCMQLKRMRTELLQKQFQAHSLVVDLIIFIFQFYWSSQSESTGRMLRKPQIPWLWVYYIRRALCISVYQCYPDQPTSAPITRSSSLSSLHKSLSTMAHLRDDLHQIKTQSCAISHHLVHFMLKEEGIQLKCNYSHAKLMRGLLEKDKGFKDAI